MKTNSTIRKDARIALQGHWGQAVLTTLVYFAIAFPATGYAAVFPEAHLWLMGASLVITLFLLCPLAVGMYNTFRCLLKDGDTNLVSNMFTKGFSNYWHIVGGYVLYELFLILWTLLLIVPGIIMSLAYFAVPFLLVEEPDLTPMEAISKSKSMMKGHKADLFLMELGFIGLIILSFVTLGIALLWLMPYMCTSLAGFYQSLKERDTAKDGL